MLLRIITTILVFLAVLSLPWWLSAVLVAACIAYFPVYIEALFLAFLFDTLYGGKMALPVALGLLLIAMIVRTRIRR